MRQSLFDYCRLYQKQNLLDEWDAERNLPLTPQTVTYGSHKSAWWRCENGHEWKAAIYTRSDGARCPYCTGRKVMVGFNDLATQSPQLARQWDYEKNVPLVPADISAGSHRSVWWRCEKGHSWRASIHSRASGCGCPVCAGRQILVGENDLATVDPELAQEWDTERNGKLTPQDVLPGTEKKVWWVCGHGHHWRAAVSARTNRQSDFVLQPINCAAFSAETPSVCATSSGETFSSLCSRCACFKRCISSLGSTAAPRFASK